MLLEDEATALLKVTVTKAERTTDQHLGASWLCSMCAICQNRSGEKLPAGCRADTGTEKRETH
jgi:hypothetical protein